MTLGRIPNTLDPPLADPNVCYKCVHVAVEDSPLTKAPASQLTAAGVGAIRGIISGFTQSNYNTVQTYIATLRAVNIFPIICIDKDTGVTAATLRSRVFAIANTIDAGVYEFGNEPGDTYSGSLSGTWSKFFDDTEIAAQVIHALGKRIILGASVDLDTQGYMDKAKARWGTSNWPVDGVAVHAYGQQGATASHANAVNLTENRFVIVRNRIPTDLGIWSTEVGWGAGGNTNSTLVAGENAINTTITDTTTTTNGTLSTASTTITAVTTTGLGQGWKVAGTGIPANTTITTVNPTTVVVNNTPTVNGVQSLTFTPILPRPVINVASATSFPNTGTSQIFVAPTGDAVQYTNKTGTSFTGCTGGSGTAGSGGLVSKIVTPSGNTITEQGLLAKDYFLRMWGPTGSFGRIKGAVTKTNLSPAGTGNDLFIKTLVWFYWQDKTSPTQWWHYCGLRGSSGPGSERDASDIFNLAGSMIAVNGTLNSTINVTSITTTGIQTGWRVLGVGIPANTTVATVAGGSLTLSAAATVSGVQALVFGPITNPVSKVNT